MPFDLLFGCPDRFLRGRMGATLYRTLGIELSQLVARTPQEYVAIAVRLATDREFRTSMQSLIQARAHRIWRRMQVVLEWELLLLTASEVPLPVRLETRKRLQLVENASDVPTVSEWMRHTGSGFDFAAFTELVASDPSYRQSQLQMAASWQVTPTQKVPFAGSVSGGAQTTEHSGQLFRQAQGDGFDPENLHASVASVTEQCTLSCAVEQALLAADATTPFTAAQGRHGPLSILLASQLHHSKIDTTSLLLGRLQQLCRPCEDIIVSLTNELRQLEQRDPVAYCETLSHWRSWLEAAIERYRLVEVWQQHKLPMLQTLAAMYEAVKYLKYGVDSIQRFVFGALYILSLDRVIETDEMIGSIGHLITAAGCPQSAEYVMLAATANNSRPGSYSLFFPPTTYDLERNALSEFCGSMPTSNSQDKVLTLWNLISSFIVRHATADDGLVAETLDTVLRLPPAGRGLEELTCMLVASDELWLGYSTVEWVHKSSSIGHTVSLSDPKVRIDVLRRVHAFLQHEIGLQPGNESMTCDIASILLASRTHEPQFTCLLVVRVLREFTSGGRCHTAVCRGWFFTIACGVVL